VTTAAANRWFIVGTTEVTAATTVGAAVTAACDGRYLVAPGCTFNLAVVAGTAAGTCIWGVEWHEVQLPLGQAADL
jgi:hypothetical protein